MECRRLSRAGRVLGLLAVFLMAATGHTQPYDPSLFGGMRWRLIGPFRGGRVVAVAGVPGQADVYYFGGVAGGVWKTTNGGETWTPLFDAQPVQSIGAIAVAPSDPNTIYVGTGEADIRSDLSSGDGVYKSADAGRTWQHAGLRETRHIGRILVDPHDPNRVFVAALGHAYGANAERGVFRSSDGGQTWQKVLYKDDNTGAVDLAFDPDDARIIYAVLWNAHRPPWSQYAPISGPGSGLYRSSDGGLTWKPVSGGGLPGGDWGRAGIAIARGHGLKRFYLILEAREGGLYRSDDDGKTWVHASRDPRIWERAWYFSGVTPDPQHPEIVYVPNVSLYRSTDGGETFQALKGAPGGDDYHQLWIDPSNPQRMIVGSDQGAVISVDGGGSWSSWYNQPTAQFYHVATDNQFPYAVYGAQQDSGTAAVASRTDYGEISFRDWHPVGGGESGYILPDPADPNVVYGGDTYGRLFRFDRRTHQSQDISPSPAVAFGVDISQRKLRFTWTSPLLFSPQDPHVLYMGAQVLLKTTDQGMTWQAISPDLTGAQPGGVAASTAGPFTPEAAKARGYGVIYTISPSPLRAAQIWVGTDTGLIHLTRDSGKTWENITPSDLPVWSKISLLEASHFNSGTAYAAVDRHRLDDYSPLILRTHDFGKSWTKIAAGIAPNSFVYAVREDSERRGLLYAGTATGVYVSFDDGDHWQALQLNLPAAPVHDLVVQGNDLVIATHGRSFWILDDITPLRQLTPEVARSKAHLFQPQVALRIRSNVGRDTPLPAETPVGENPPDGAIIDYYLAEPPAGDVVLEILDSAGKLVRRFSSEDQPQPPTGPLRFTENWLRPEQPLPKSAGMYRVAWNFRYPAPPALFRQYSIAAAFGRGVTALPLGPMVLPGQYQIRLRVGGETHTRPLAVQADPRATVSREHLARQFELEMKLAVALEEDYRAYREVQNLRAELNKLVPQLAEHPDSGLRALVEALDQKAAMLEGAAPARSENLRALSAQLGNLLDVVDSADHAPTTQATAAAQEAMQTLDKQLAAWDSLRRTDLPALNEALRKNGLPPIAIASERSLD